MAKKSIEWADILGPARDFEAAVTKTRNLYDLPLVADGAKEIALLSIFKEEQRFAFQPVMRALQRLSQLTDWSHSFFVCDRVESEFFDWRRMPLRQYVSFEDFYHRELEEVWGKWETLQATWAEVVRGAITEDEGQSIVLRTHGGDRRSEQARADQADNNSGIISLNHGTSREYTIARLEKKNRTDLAAKVRAKTMSANAAAIEAGFRKKPKSKKRSRVDKVMAAIERMTNAEQRAIWRKLKARFGA
jgi:hypothetical protein